MPASDAETRHVIARRHVAEGQHLDGDGPALAEAFRHLALIDDDDVLRGREVDDLLADVSASAPLDEIERGAHLVGAVDPVPRPMTRAPWTSSSAASAAMRFVSSIVAAAEYFLLPAASTADGASVAR